MVKLIWAQCGDNSEQYFFSFFLLHRSHEVRMDHRDLALWFNLWITYNTASKKLVARSRCLISGALVEKKRQILSGSLSLSAVNIVGHVILWYECVLGKDNI